MQGVLGAFALDEALIFKFIKFGLVGFSGIFVDFSVTYLLKEKLQIQKYLANSSGFLVATVSNYLLNRFWTFHSVDPAAFMQFSKFLGIAVIGLTFNNLIIFILNDKLKINFYLSKIFAIGAVSLWSFFANYVYTFAR
jgi:putative flippase GtrA